MAFSAPYSALPYSAPAYSAPAFSTPPAGNWFSRLTSGAKVALVGGGVVGLVLVCCGALAVLGALSPPSPKRTVAQGNPAAGTGAGSGANGAQNAPNTQNGPITSAPPAPAAPVVETKTVTQTEPVPFATRTVNDATLAKGSTRIRTAGVAGQKTVTYLVTYTDGVETARKAVSEVVTRPPVTQVTAIGTKSAAPPPPPDQPAPGSGCDPNYTPCVPIASDVDCAGGSGDGPAYVQGPVTVIGKDIYKLDTDHDGIGCEN